MTKIISIIMQLHSDYINVVNLLSYYKVHTSKYETNS